MPVTATLIAGGVTGAQQLLAAAQQKRRARQVRVVDSQTPAEAQALALGQQQAYAQMPGEATAVNRLNQGFANSAAALGQGAVSAGGFLGGLSRVDANRSAGLVGLADQSARYRTGQMANLQALYARRGAQQRADRERAAAERAALIEGSNRNLQGGLSTLGTAAVQGAYLRSAAPAPAPAATATPSVVTAAPPASAYNQFLIPGARIPGTAPDMTMANLLRRQRSNYVPYADPFAQELRGF